MIDCKPVVSDAVKRLMEMEDELVYAKDLAPVLKMNPDVIIHHAKNGDWRFCKFVISGNRVKFFRRDFLQQCGYLSKEEPEPTADREALAAAIEALEAILNSQKEILKTLNEGINLLQAIRWK